MFNRVLIANRGEIACRVIRTLRRLGVESVAVYSDADSDSRHVREADQALRLGPAPAADSYLNGPRVLAAVERSGATAVHPGYGFLSENTDFARSCQAAGVAFVGPTPEQILRFGLKHEARQLALDNDVPCLPGGALVADVDEAVAQAREVGFPVMLKSTAGGGGIGMSVCRDADTLAERFDGIVHLSRSNFGSAGVFVEKFVEHARHVEVQAFGDGAGRVLTLGERDCSAQRRNQKVIEETPAPRLDASQRAGLAEAATRLLTAVHYRSAGTVEFLLDSDTGDAYFLEVNTRLQVEHGVTEEVFGVDLVEWMLRLAAGDGAMFDSPLAAPNGHSIQARIYAEDPARNFQPSPGLLTAAEFPDDVRVETWVDAGCEVSPHYDPMIAKLVVHAADRPSAVAALDRALAGTRLGGIETNVAYLRSIAQSATFTEGKVITGTLSQMDYAGRGVEVIAPGTQTTVQDWPGRVGYWDVGIPPSGPMDDRSLRLANRAVGNPEGAAALELTLSGPTLRFRQDTLIALAGAPLSAKLDGEVIAAYEPVAVRAGQLLEVGRSQGAGVRAYLAVRGGFDVPVYLGSRATFTLGRFGGHGGRTLRAGDVLPFADTADSTADTAPAPIPPDERPTIGDRWELSVLYGPHGAPEFFTAEDIDTFFDSDYEVHHNSARTGVRLTGPKPRWARSDGGEAGLHPSNIHDCAYAVGSVDFTGDMPILLGPDGPSLGGFVCPATVVSGDLWKLGQLAPGDRVRFRPVSWADGRSPGRAKTLPPDSSVLTRIDETATSPAVTYRQSGDSHLLVEYGPMQLDLDLRLRAHALHQALLADRLDATLELTPGIRSLQVHYDPTRLSQSALLNHLQRIEGRLDPSTARVPTRIVRLPLSWDDPATRLAIDKYTQLVRPDAPWAPSNIEFIRRINGLDSIADVHRIVFDASYLVMGLGDVYLGAPVATPLDPRHRLVTTKYNPARTWTPENAVGIGGAYLCIYGMEGPGGYQFVGRTLQVFNRFRQSESFEPGKPWLLRFFDQIRFHEVSAPELLEMREAFAAGRLEIETEESTFDLSTYHRFLHDEADSIAAFKATQQSAFEAERQRWVDNGQLSFSVESEVAAVDEDAIALSPGQRPVQCAVPGNVWKIPVAVGDRVAAGQTLLVIESMKMEIDIVSPCAGRVARLLCAEGQGLSQGRVVAVIEEAP